VFSRSDSYVDRQSVLVTGATGFIGRAACAALEEAGWAVTKGVRGNPAQENAISLDLSDPATMLTLEKVKRYDAIVHLGAKITLSGASEDEMFVSNVLSTGCLAYLAKNWDAHLVFASTAIVCGARQQSITTDSLVIADTPYAKTKWLAEQIIDSAHPSHCVLRIGGVFGYQGPIHLGLNRAIDGALHRERPTQVGGEALRNYVYVKDVAQSIAFAAQRRLEGTHLLAGHEIMSVSAMMQALCDVFNPGTSPLIKDGPEAMSQVIAPSLDLPATRSFRAALLDIHQEGCR
jgi:nucleoside-diphosphate-sugar epimerase